MQELRTQLQEIDTRLRDKRQELARAQKLLDQTKATYAEHESDGAYEAAQGAGEAVKVVRQEIDGLQDEQTALLRRLGDYEAGHAGFAAPGVSGWERAARTLSLSEGRLRTDVGAAQLLAQAQPVGPAPPTPPATVETVVPLGNRWLYPVLGGALPLDVGDTVATDFTIEFTDPVGTSGLTGVERAPDETDPKATLGVTTALAQVAARQHAVVSEPVPNAIISDQVAFRAYLDGEMNRRLSEDFDRAVVDKIEAAGLPTSTGTGDLVVDLRNAISAMSDRGAVPSIVALTPSDAAQLDLTQDGGGSYIFTVRIAGSGSPVWNLQVREVPEVSAPLLVAPNQLGVLRLGSGSVALDPYGGGGQDNFARNLTRVRIEFDGAYHVRDVRGAHTIS